MCFPASAKDLPNLPGRPSGGVNKTIIFNVSAEPGGFGIHGAVVSCQVGVRTKRMRTDRTGTAPLSVTYEGRPRDRDLECLISKNGYMPAVRTIDLRAAARTEFVRIGMRDR